jgi:hypothetical protein
MGVAVVVTVVISAVLTVVVLVTAGWTAGRPRFPGGQHDLRDRRARRGRDAWHAPPQPEVVGRPAGADAEADAADQARRTPAPGPG